MKHRLFLVQATWFATLVACTGPKVPVEQTSDPVKVRTATVQSLPQNQQFSYSGTIEAFQTIPVGFRTAGTVQSVLVDEGMPVRKGQALASLDKADLESMYALSEAQYKQALDAYERLSEIRQKGSLPEIKWVEMESNLKQAESSMKLAKSNLEKAVLTSPENGVVGKRRIEPGMSSFGIESPFDVVKIDKVYVTLSVPENEIAQIRKGMEVTFRVPAVGDALFTGKVTLVGVVADKISRTYEVKALTENADQLLKPGMMCDATVNCEQVEMTLVDYHAVTHDVDGAFVYKVAPNNATVIKQPVKVGKLTSQGVEVLSGLVSGDKVVCEGMDKLSENSKITL